MVGCGSLCDYGEECEIQLSASHPPGSDLMCLWSPSGSISLWQTPYCSTLSAAATITEKKKELKKGTQAVIKAEIPLRTSIWSLVTNWAPVISLYMVEGLGCWPAKIPCQQISLVTGARLLFPCGVCVHVCVWASAKDLQIARRTPEFIYRPSVTAAQGQRQQVIYIQCTRMQR